MVYSYSARRVRADVPASIPLLQVQVDHRGLARRHRAYRRPSPPDLVMHIKVVTAAYLVRSDWTCLLAAPSRLASHWDLTVRWSRSGVPAPCEQVRCRI